MPHEAVDSHFADMVHAAKKYWCSVVVDSGGVGSQNDSQRINERIDYDVFIDHVVRMSRLPRFVVTEQLLMSVPAESLNRTLAAMHACNFIHLPFPEVIVEVKRDMSATTDGIRSAISSSSCFIYFRERQEGTDADRLDVVAKNDKVMPMFHPFEAETFTWVRYRDDRGSYLVISPWVHRIALLPDLTKVGWQPDDEEVIKADGRITFSNRFRAPRYLNHSDSDADFIKFYRSFTENNAVKSSRVASRVLGTLIVLLRTRGVNVEHKHHEKLDAVRAKKGYPSIGKYINLKIGEVYDASGEKVVARLSSSSSSSVHTSTHSSSGEPAYSVRPHLRRGHVRMQAHGPGRSERKLIFIQPCWINADETAYASVQPNTYRVT